ncbi:MAG: toxin-antitoxin system YwqK family antitoxin [Helicobacter sp.]|uniref:toxin-antitoxin system YwqK family antitoxin n=1 Tax=Helicobacter sp. TaxID=218 RepID=UPI002A914D38|nr:toxin-antitoxin system YwqK family antitoxin [Helicobacter sp.]MDY5821302.1 toxin-antitoxin system YwqK family antitoxin [Helicobacter sp.]
MDSFKKIAIGFGLVSVITLQGLQANRLKECESDADKASGCVEIKYYPNGDIEREIPWKNSELNGVQKIYYSNGQLAKEIPWKNSKPNGTEKEYSGDGRIVSETIYKSDGINYVVKDYYENGQLGAEIPYTKDSVNGIVKAYYDTGVLAFEGFVLGGSRNFTIGDDGSSGTGDHKYYSQNGKLLGIARYDKEARFQFVKCAEKKLSHEEAAGLKSALTHENFEKYCSKIEEKHGNEE